MNSQSSGAALKQAEVPLSLHDANQAFYDALNKVLQGDTSLMESVWSHADDVMLLGPFGGRQKGWNEVQAEFDQQCKMKMGGQITPQAIQVMEQGDVAILSCMERGYLSSYQNKSITLYQRAVNVFRKEEGSWKLAFHQTDASSQLQGGDWAEGTYGQEGCDD